MSKPTNIIFNLALLFIISCSPTEKKNTESIQNSSQKENVSKEYKGFVDKFYEKDLPLSFTQKTIGEASPYRTDNILKFSKIENSELKFLKDSLQKLSPYFEIVRTAVYRVQTTSNFSLLSYLKLLSGKDDEHEHSGPTYDKFILVTIANEKPIDTLLVAGGFDQSSQISGAIDENLNVTTQRFDFLHSIVYDSSKFETKYGIRAIETVTEYQITQDGHFKKLKSTKKEGDYKTVYNKEGFYPVDYPEK